MRAQQHDPSTRDIIHYLETREVRGVESPDARKKFIAKCTHNYTVRTEYYLPALYYIPQLNPHHPLPPQHVMPYARLVIPASFRKQLMEAYHDSPFGGHLGISKTFAKLSARYWWPSIYKDVDDHVHECKRCQLSKRQRWQAEVAQPPYYEPVVPFETIAIDYAGPFVTSYEYKYILVVVDTFSRYAITIPTMNTDAGTTARALVHEVFARHGCPKAVLSDNGSHFNNAVIRDICKQLGIKKLWTSPYRPQSNGRAERFIGTLKTVLRTFCGDPNAEASLQQHQRDWLVYLQPATFAYNTAPSESTGFTPYFTLFGRVPRMPGDFADLERADPDVEMTETARVEEYAADLHSTLVDTHKTIHGIFSLENLQRARENLKHATIHVYQPGDLVYRSLPNVAIGKGPFSRPFEGPFVIVNRIGMVTYEIRHAERPNARTEIVHVTRLKRYVSNTTADKDPGGDATVKVDDDSTAQHMHRAKEVARTARNAGSDAADTNTTNKRTSHRKRAPQTTKTPTPHTVHPSRAASLRSTVPSLTPINTRSAGTEFRPNYSERLHDLRSQSGMIPQRWYSLPPLT